MADKKISDLERLTNEVTPETLLEVAYKDDFIEEPVTRAVTAEQIAELTAKGVEFASDLDTNAKTVIGAINEVNEKAGHGGGGGSNVTMNDNPDGGVDLTVDSTTRTLIKKDEPININRAYSDTKTSENQITAYGVSVVRADGAISKEALAMSVGEDWAYVQLGAWDTETGADKTAILGSTPNGSYMALDDAEIDATKLAEVLTHEGRIEALESGGSGGVTKDYVDNGFTGEPNVIMDTFINTTGTESKSGATGYCVTAPLYIDASKTITWNCGKHTTKTACLVLYTEAGAKILYKSMNADSITINLADYPTYSYLRATFWAEDTAHKTITDADGNVLFEVNLVGEHVEGLVGLNENVTALDSRVTIVEGSLLKVMKKIVFNGTIAAKGTGDWVNIPADTGIANNRIVSLTYSTNYKEADAKTVTSSTGYNCVVTNNHTGALTIQVEAMILYI